MYSRFVLFGLIISVVLTVSSCESDNGTDDSVMNIDVENLYGKWAAESETYTFNENGILVRLDGENKLHLYNWELNGNELLLFPEGSNPFDTYCHYIIAELTFSRLKFYDHKDKSLTYTLSRIIDENILCSGVWLRDSLAYVYNADGTGDIWNVSNAQNGESHFSWRIKGCELAIFYDQDISLYMIEKLTDSLFIYSDSEDRSCSYHFIKSDMSKDDYFDVLYSSKYPVSFSCDISMPPFNSIHTLGCFITVRQRPTKDGYTVYTNTGMTYEYPLTEVQSRVFSFGLAGLIIGSPRCAEGEVYAYDLGCPQCDVSSARLSITKEGLAICNKCGNTYDLNNNAKSAEDNSCPYRYRTMLEKNFLMVYN